MGEKATLWERYVMAYLTLQGCATRSRTKTENLNKETEKSMENLPSQPDVTESPSISHHAGVTPASCLTPSKGLAEWKFMQQTMQKNCVVASPSELKGLLTEYEIANLP